MLCLLVCAIVAFACLAAYPACNARQEQLPQAYKGVLRVWHIDSFEGGTGSRAAFLRSAAREFEEESGMYVLITVHTAESAAHAAEKGMLPDVLSFGRYFDFAADSVKPLQGYDFCYSSQGGKTYAVPWCRGNYFLFREIFQTSHPKIPSFRTAGRSSMPQPLRKVLRATTSRRKACVHTSVF